MFDEIPIHIKRSHLMQAFLVEYVYPQLPSYSTRIDENMNMTDILSHDLQCIDSCLSDLNAITDDIFKAKYKTQS